MAVKDVQKRKVLENIPSHNLVKEIRKLTLPTGVFVRVIIETVDEPPRHSNEEPDEVGLQFLEEVEQLPIVEDLPEDLSYQHDHYLYGHPKKQ